MILDHVRFTPTFLPNEKGTWALAAVSEDDNGYSVHKLLVSEVRQVLALPEVLGKFAPNAGAFSRLREFAAIAILHGSQEGEHYRIHRNLVDNVASALTDLGFDFSKHKEFRKEGDRIVAQETKPGTVSQLAQRVAELQAIVDKRADRQWDPIVELFHPDMNVSDIQRAATKLLELFTRTQEFFRSTPHLLMDQPVREKLGECYTALWSGRKTQLEKDEQRPTMGQAATQESARLGSELANGIVAAFWRDRYEDLKLGLENRLAGKHVQPAYQENAVLLARVPHAANAIKRPDPYATAEALWILLDDISTLSDSIKPDDLESYQLFYRHAYDVAKRRHQFLASDGYRLNWPDGAVLEQRAAAKLEDLAEAIESASHGYAWTCEYPENATLAKAIDQLFTAAHPATAAPIPMLLHCPMCHARHIDEGEFATKAHHTHACQGFVVEEGKRFRCGHVWRPAIVATVGVEALPGFVSDIVEGGMIAEGEAIVGKRARDVANGFEGTIKSYSVSEDTYLLSNVNDTRMALRRHEFTVLGP